MVGVGECNEVGFVGFSLDLPILVSELEGDFDRRRAVVGVKDFGEAAGCDIGETGGQEHGGDVSEAEQRAMGDAVELCLHGCVYQWVCVSVDIDPKRRDSVEVPVALAVAQPDPFGTFDDEGVGLGPAPHGCERVPYVGAVQGYEDIVCRGEKRGHLVFHGCVSWGLFGRAGRIWSRIASNAAMTRAMSWSS